MVTDRAGRETPPRRHRALYGFLRDEHEWDERWLVVTVAVPESQRKLRHRLRTQLTWLGMGSLAPGLWVVPDADKEQAVAEILDDLNLRATAFAWTGPWAPIGNIDKLIGAAWSLGEVAEEYREFTETFAASTAETSTESFVSQVRVVHAWRRFPFLDPALPVSLLPADWPATAAVELFARCHTQWYETAQKHWDGREEDAG